ncbi:hypothetical protein Z517_11400 [Fonsecaea pedrosoi CBS 271.37]|uniref:Uncharacterized protein n=1 Tax=Fonsecaea pedrosoi CBS 271.37 TaxID=1442368 RepID=A0A0D2G7B9_9EURO|nr:uncharacterized protein Z517_11400 [Fonsecaea pedrosoi CBS 271.37]KIW74630.1 hypothetical protein Z517_11400 [Fonsecaea pedrosoi CBS 271.37]
MASLTPRRKARGFMSLPAEVRLNIYNLLVSSTMLINLCQPPLLEPDHLPFRKGSPVSEMSLQILALETIIRSHGLHLLVVGDPVRGEVESLLRQRVVRYHCPDCLTRWLRNLSYGLSVRFDWVEKLEIMDETYRDAMSGFSMVEDFYLSRLAARDMMERYQAIVSTYSGRMDLVHPPRTWHFELFIEVPEELLASTGPLEPGISRHSTRLLPESVAFLPSLDFGGTFKWIMCGTAHRES